MKTYADWGPPNDPTYQRLIELVSTTLVDVHLTDHDGQISVMQVVEEDKRALVYVLHGVSYVESDFTDAVMALLGTRAPAVNWYVVPMDDDDGDQEPSTNVIGVYDADMPPDVITVVT